jgi:hypothetical protein
MAGGRSTTFLEADSFQEGAGCKQPLLEFACTPRRQQWLSVQVPA